MVFEQNHAHLKVLYFILYFIFEVSIVLVLLCASTKYQKKIMRLYVLVHIFAGTLIKCSSLT